MKLSIVTTLYFSAIHIKEFYERTSKVAQELVGEKYELIMVDDGSPDESLMTAVALTKEDHHLKILELSKNYGHHKALMTGLMHAKGDLVFLIDSDLEEEPEWLIPFAIEMQKKKCDVVYGVQEKRKGGYLEKLSGNFVCLYIDLAIHLQMIHPRNHIEI